MVPVWRASCQNEPNLAFLLASSKDLFLLQVVLGFWILKNDGHASGNNSANDNANASDDTHLSDND